MDIIAAVIGILGAMTDITVAVIGAMGVIVAAWITVKSKGRKKGRSEHLTREVVHGDKVGGDVVGRDKIESHEHIHVERSGGERKNALVYFLEKMFAFIFTVAIAGLVFGGIGAAIGSTVDGEEIGAVIGGVMALIAGIVNAGSVKRTKGLM